MQKLKHIIFLLLILSIFIPNAFSATNEEIREQAKLLYLGQKPLEAREHILLIPADQRTAEDYFFMGLTGQKALQITKPYENAIEKNQKFYQAYYNLGDYYYKDKNYERAIYYYKQAVKYNKKFDYGYYNLGCVYLEKGQFNDARKSFEKAIEIQPEEPDYYYNLGYAYNKLNNPKRAEKAVKLYNELMQKRNEN